LPVDFKVVGWRKAKVCWTIEKRVVVIQYRARAAGKLRVIKIKKSGIVYIICREMAADVSAGFALGCWLISCQLWKNCVAPTKMGSTHWSGLVKSKPKKWLLSISGRGTNE